MAELDEIGQETDFYLFPPDGLWSTDPILRKAGSSYFYYQTDHLGTPQQLNDGTGAVVHSREMRAFGEVAATGIEDRWRFPGQLDSAEIGLYYNYFRDYAPGRGRYVQSDPFGLLGSANLFGYADQDPILKRDPLGLLFEDWIDPSNPLPDYICLMFRICPDVNEVDIPRLPEPWEEKINEWKCKAICHQTLRPICIVMGSGFGAVCVIPGGIIGNPWVMALGGWACQELVTWRCNKYVKDSCDRECAPPCK